MTKIAYLDLLSFEHEPVVVSVARRNANQFVTTQFVQGRSLTPEALATTLHGCSAVITTDVTSNLSELLAGCPDVPVIRVDPQKTGLVANTFVGALLRSELSVCESSQERSAHGLWQMYANRGVQPALDELLKDARSRLDMLIDVAAILNRHAKMEK